MKKIIATVLTLVMVLSGVSVLAEAFNAAHDIVILSREDGSGTRGAFVELFGVEVKNAEGQKVDMTTEEAVITNSTAVCMTSVAGNDYAIGYISLGSLGDTVKALSVNGVEATAQNIVSGSYTISRPFNIAVKDDPSELAGDFIAYIMSAEGQRIVGDNGYIPVENVQPYAGSAIAGRLVVGGSSSVTPVMEKLAEGYKAVNPSAELEIQQSDSTSGMNGVVDGVLDIGMASRALKDSELEAGLTPTVIAMDGIAVIVNKANPLNDITSEQVKQIYTGEAYTWDEIIG